MLLQDRTTAEIVELFIADGVFGMEITTGIPDDEPLFADAKAGKDWRLFVSDGVLAWEEATGIAVDYVETIDRVTGIRWRLYILDGQFAYSHIILGIQTVRRSDIDQSEGVDSLIRQEGDGISPILNDGNKYSLGEGNAERISEKDDQVERVSVLEESVQFDCNQSTGISLDSRAKVPDTEDSERFGSEEIDGVVTDDLSEVGYTERTINMESRVGK